jgi:hypothetical protein
MNKAFALLLVAGLGLGMSSCLKDDEHYTDFQNVGYVAEIPSSAFFGVVDNEGFPIQTTPYAYPFDVNIASPNPPTQNVDVTVGVDAAALTRYNAANGDSLQLLPAEAYSLGSTTVTVPAGKRLATVDLKFNTSKIAVNGYYALPITIKSASNNVAVSANYGTKIIVIKIKNIYDGQYRALGTFTHPTAGARKIDRDKTLITIDGTTSQTDFADLGGNGWQMWLRVNADNTVTLIPKGAANPGTVQFGVNKYDPATKSFTLNYKYAGAGGDRVINEVITKK